jgi:hypothetical protein
MEATNNVLHEEKALSGQLVQQLSEDLSETKSKLQKYEDDIKASTALQEKLQEQVILIEEQKYSLTMEQNKTVQDLISMRKELDRLLESEESMKLMKIDHDTLQDKYLKTKSLLDETVAKVSSLQSDLELSQLSHNNVSKEKDSIQTQLIASKVFYDSLIYSSSDSKKLTGYEEQIESLTVKNESLQARVAESERENVILLNELSKEKESVHINQVLVTKAEQKFTEAQQVIAHLRSVQEINNQKVNEKYKLFSNSTINEKLILDFNENK